MRAWKWIRGSALALCGALSFTACGADDAIDRVIDCDDICSQYRDCFDDSYDVSDCAERCRDRAEDDEDFERKVDECAACIDDRSCTEAVFPCADECLGVVP
ncbi:MAG TPA: hypothetical protein VKY73_12985 [Polyangiaceae bacterium]|nr:hypothetical protein [Polyangiaceae bacterium]